MYIYVFNHLISCQNSMCRSSGCRTSGMHRLCAAAYNRHTEVVQQLLVDKTDVNACYVYDEKLTDCLQL